MNYNLSNKIKLSELENYIQGYKKEYDSKVESATSFDMNWCILIELNYIKAKYVYTNR